MRRFLGVLAFVLLSVPLPALAVPHSLCGLPLGVPCPNTAYQFTDLVVDVSGTPQVFFPEDISASGKLIVGTTAAFPPTPMVLTRNNGNSTFVTLTPNLPPSATFPRPTTINDFGVVGGLFLDADRGFSSRGFVHQQGNFTTVVDVTFGDPNSPTVGLDTRIGGINNFGHLTANYFDPGTFDFRAAVSFDGGLTWTDILGVDDSLNFFVEEITENGTVVGPSSDPLTAFVCKDAGRATETCDEVVVGQDPYKIVLTAAADGGNEVAKSLLAGSYTDPQGFLFDGDVFMPMDFPGAASTIPTGVASDGTVVGVYQLPGSFLFRGFLATPVDVTVVPAPASLLLLGAGIAGALLSLRRRRSDPSPPRHCTTQPACGGRGISPNSAT